MVGKDTIGLEWCWNSDSAPSNDCCTAESKRLRKSFVSFFLKMLPLYDSFLLAEGDFILLSMMEQRFER